MTRAVVVAADAELRRDVVAALRSAGRFDEVTGASREDEVVGSTDVVVIVRNGRPGGDVSRRDAALSDSDTIPALSGREAQILSLLADGLSNKQIAARLGISANTVKTHMELMFDKLDVSTRAEAVAVGARHGLLML